MARQDITQLLEAHADGDQEALADLFQGVYDELRRVARGQLYRHGQGNTLDTTGLVHEAYLKLVRSESSPGQNRGHFFAVAAQAMRHILVDFARRRMSNKRGGDFVRVDLETGLDSHDRQAELVLSIHSALDGLRGIDARLVTVVECRYFAGLTEAETAEALSVSISTVQRSWRAAKTYLGQQLASASS